MAMSGQIKRPAYQTYKLFWSIVDWVFPPRCGGCDRLGVRWCQDCQASATRVTQPLCVICGRPITAAGICPECSTHPPIFDCARAFFTYSGAVREAIHRLKYKRDIGLGDALAVHLMDLLSSLSWQCDLIVPVPLSAARLKDRGYNQASLLALPIAYAFGVKYESGLLERSQEINSQVGLGRALRQANVAGAFRATRHLVEPKTILIIDDVLTTGATLNACAAALKDAGARAVFGLTLARAVSHDPLARIQP